MGQGGLGRSSVSFHVAHPSSLAPSNKIDDYQTFGHLFLSKVDDIFTIFNFKILLGNPME